MTSQAAALAPRAPELKRFGSPPRAALGALLWLVACGSAPAAAPSTLSPAPIAPPPPRIEIVPQRDWRDAVLYFVIVDRFADGNTKNNRAADPTAKGAFHGGDLRGLAAELDEIAGLGATALWITPVVRNIPGFVTGAGFQDWGYHGYWADDFESLDPRFGSEADLAALVREAHARGLKVLLDVVYNHVGYGSQYLIDARTKGWLRAEERGNCGSDDLTSCLSGLPDFRTEMPQVAEYLFKAHLGLAKRVGLDGFRLDTVKHVDHSFWKTHRERTRAELSPDFFLVGEVWGGNELSLDPWFAGDEMDAGFDFSFQGSTVAWLSGRGRTVAFARYLEGREKVRQGYLLAHFLSSHDVPGALHLLNGDRARFRLAAVLQMTLAGLPTVFYGEEVGRKIGDWPENRGNMPWGDRPISPNGGARDEALRADYQRLIAARRAHPVLSTGAQRTLSSDGDVLVFARENALETVLVAVHRGAATAQATVATPAAWRGRRLRELLSGRELGVAGESLTLEVPALEALIVVAEGGEGRNDG